MKLTVQLKSKSMLISLPGEPEEGFLEVVVTLGGDIVVLKILLSVEHNALSLDLPVLDIHLVPGQHDGDVLADPDQIPMPVRHVLIGDTRGYVEHDDGTLTLNICDYREFLDLTTISIYIHTKVSYKLVSFLKIYPSFISYRFL